MEATANLDLAARNYRELRSYLIAQDRWFAFCAAKGHGFAKVPSMPSKVRKYRAYERSGWLTRYLGVADDAGSYDGLHAVCEDAQRYLRRAGVKVPNAPQYSPRSPFEAVGLVYVEV